MKEEREQDFIYNWRGERTSMDQERKQAIIMDEEREQANIIIKINFCGERTRCHNGWE